jgi:hypothetical protein
MHCGLPKDAHREMNQLVCMDFTIARDRVTGRVTVYDVWW